MTEGKEEGLPLVDGGPNLLSWRSASHSNYLFLSISLTLVLWLRWFLSGCCLTTNIPLYKTVKCLTYINFLFKFFNTYFLLPVSVLPLFAHKTGGISYAHQPLCDGPWTFDLLMNGYSESGKTSISRTILYTKIYQQSFWFENISTVTVGGHHAIRYQFTVWRLQNFSE